MRNKYSLFLILFAAMSLVTISCGGSNSSNTNSDNGDYDLLRIGMLIPMTGTGPFQKESEKAAVDIAVDDVNDYLEQIGSNKSIEPEIRDTQFDPITIGSALSELNESGIKIVVAACTSTDLTYVKPYIDEHGILLINKESTSPTLSVTDNIYRLISDDNYLAQVLSEVYDENGIDKIVILYRGDVWCAANAQAIESALESGPGEVIQLIGYDPRANGDEYSARVQEVNDAVAAALLSTTADRIAVQLISFEEGTEILERASGHAELGQVTWFGSDGFTENQELLQNTTAAAFAVQVGMYSPAIAENSSEAYQAIKGEIAAKIGYEPYSWAMLMYDAVWLASKTGLDPEYDDDISVIKELFLKQVDSYEAVTGPINLNDAGDRTESPYDFWSVQENNGIFRWVKSFTYDDGFQGV